MFWIGCLRGARSVSSFCDFQKMAFGYLTAFLSFLTQENLVFFRYSYYGVLKFICVQIWLISSPEPKAQVSYCRPFSSVVRRPSSVNFLNFHLLLENAWLDFNQTWQESSLGVGIQSCSNRMCGPKGPKPCKFQTSSSPDPEGEWWSYIVCRYLIRWKIKVVHGSSQGGPNRPLWALCKK